MHPVNRPEVIVTFAAQKIDENGNVTDEHTKQKIGELLAALVELTERLH
jgi:chromate reductase